MILDTYCGSLNWPVKVEQIRAFKRELRSRPIAGDVYTQAISIEDEINGIIDAKTGTLLVPPGVLHTDNNE